MRKVVLYIAMSLDGYIADENGDVAWLLGDGSEPNNQGSYPSFIETVDTIIMGYRTYHQIATQLFPDGWPYVGKMCYIITHRELISKPGIQFTSQSLPVLLEELRKQNGKNIWICGGASIANQFLKNDSIDRFCISIIPTILGKGIRLFSTYEKEMQLELISTRSYNGITDLIYERKKC